MSGEIFSGSIGIRASIKTPLLRHVLSEVEGSEGSGLPVEQILWQAGEL
jgi:hypothetical protein